MTDKFDLKILFIAYFIILLLPGNTQAHKARVFAWAQENTITVECSFSRGKKMINGSVTVKDGATGTILAEGTTDKSGIFTFPVTDTMRNNQLTLIISADGGDGHRADWTMSPEDYLTYPQREPYPKTSTVAEKKSYSNRNESTALSAEELDRILEAKIAPIRKSIASLADPEPEFKDIIGGLGYLIGIAGIVAWIKSLRKKQ